MQTVIDEKKAAETYQKEWDSFECIRTEFAGNFDCYASFRRGEDDGSIKTPLNGKPRISVLNLAELTELERQLTLGLRDKFGSLDAYRSHRYSQVFGRQ